MEYWTKYLKSLCYANKAKMMGDIISPTDKNIALLALLIFYTISSSPVEWALVGNGGRSLKKEHTLCFHLQTQAADEDTNTVTGTTPQRFRIFPPTPLPRATLLPHFCWRLPFPETSEANCVTTPSPIPNAFSSKFSQIISVQNQQQ